MLIKEIIGRSVKAIDAKVGGELQCLISAYPQRRSCSLVSMFGPGPGKFFSFFLSSLVCVLQALGTVGRVGAHPGGRHMKGLNRLPRNQ